MYLKITPSYKGKLYLSFVQGYRDENGKSKQKTIEKIGYLDDLKKIYEDPISYFKEIAKQRNNEQINELTIKNLNSKKIELNSKTKNLGYVLLKKIYKELGIDEFLNNKQTNLKIKYKLDDIFSMLVYMRILKPGSKKDAFENKDMLFEKYDFSLDDLYRSLTILNPLKDHIQKVIWENTKEKYNRDTSRSYYDCTNYYFEIEYNDEDIFEYDENGNVILDENGSPKILESGLRKRGPEKNHRPDPIVEMGLLMDSSGIPMSYHLFPGNESEKNSLVPILNRTRTQFDIGRTIVVADRGLNCSENIIYISGTTLEESLKRNGYVYGQSVRGADAEFKEWVLSNDYTIDTFNGDNDEIITFKHKSRVYPKKMYVIRDDKGKTKSGNKVKETTIVDQKQMVYYSEKYAKKQKHDRDLIIKKAEDLIAHPDKYSRATSYGVAGYVKNLKFVKSTGEIADKDNLFLNIEKIKEEEKYDGYYSIVTSEEKLTDFEIRNIYKGLSKIEETFKVTKSGFSSRPVWLSRADHIQSHFLICFVSLVIIRLLEKTLDDNYPFQKIIDSIKNYTSNNIEHDIYMQNFRNNIIEDFEKKLNIDLSKKYMSLSQIKNFLNFEK